MAKVAEEEKSLAGVSPDIQEVPAEGESETVLQDVIGEKEYILDDDTDEVVDTRLKDYPVPLVARTVPLYNEPTYVTMAALFFSR